MGTLSEMMQETPKSICLIVIMQPETKVGKVTTRVC